MIAWEVRGMAILRTSDHESLIDPLLWRQRFAVDPIKPCRVAADPRTAGRCRGFRPVDHGTGWRSAFFNGVNGWTSVIVSTT